MAGAPLRPRSQDGGAEGALLLHNISRRLRGCCPQVGLPWSLHWGSVHVDAHILRRCCFGCIDGTDDLLHYKVCIKLHNAAVASFPSVLRGTEVGQLLQLASLLVEPSEAHSLGPVALRQRRLVLLAFL